METDNLWSYTRYTLQLSHCPMDVNCDICFLGFIFWIHLEFPYTIHQCNNINNYVAVFWQVKKCIFLKYKGLHFELTVVFRIIMHWSKWWCSIVDIEYNCAKGDMVLQDRPHDWVKDYMVVLITPHSIVEGDTVLEETTTTTITLLPTNYNIIINKNKPRWGILNVNLLLITNTGYLRATQPYPEKE